MKRILVFAFSFLMLAGATVAQAAGEKIGYVDLARIFDEYQKTKSFDKTLEAKGSSKQGERDKMVNEIKKLRDEAELLGAKAKDEKQVAIDEKIKTLQDFDRNTRDALRKERDGMVRDILKEIETVIQDYGKAQGYSFIFNDRVLVFKSEGSDLTNQIIKTLNDSYAKKS
ncbi:MAG TPA: OmpH family outer membrane protein [Candidatus Eisenbacteria bacterium]|nr:OmpH family outer membrane protein [Candidatus Eisenbacteria bacterium]